MSFVNDECGATAIEYGLILSFWLSVILTGYNLAYVKVANSFDLLSQAMTISL